MATYAELMQQSEELASQAKEARKQEMAGAIDQIKSIMTQFGITADDIGGGNTSEPKTARVAGVPKYRDPNTGATWTGKGRRPNWAQGADLGTLAIN
jgi:DNA-binding protein H-NS